MKDPAIRKILRDTELSHFESDPNSLVLEELSLPVAKARIDMAVVNGSLHGYEIKSASDTLQRLPGQIEAYTKVFDYLSIVTEQKYSNRLVELLPKWIGIIVCDDDEKRGATIHYRRKPKLNKRKEAFFLAKLLWHDEIVDVLEEYNIPFRKKDRTWLLCEALSSSLDVETISFVVRSKLKNRKGWKMNLKKAIH